MLLGREKVVLRATELQYRSFIPVSSSPSRSPLAEEQTESGGERQQKQDIMAMSKGTSHYNRQAWEDSNFPILCKTCLGDNNFIRMMVDKYGSECKICQRPFTTFRWNPGAKMRYKKTEICQTCSRAKNVCQTCLLDLEFGLPVQVRDSLSNVKQNLPVDEVNRAYYNQCLDKAIAESDPTEVIPALKAAAPSDALVKLARTAPYYKRNRAHICSFWVKGECRRGEECPYRHDKPSDPDDPLSDQNLKDRYYGSNDPVAEKLLKRAAEMPRPIPPEDKSITTVYIGNCTQIISEQDLRDHFKQFGEIRTIHIVSKQNCAFITFTTRSATEAAVEKSFQKLTINGQKLTVRWGRSLAKRGKEEGKVQTFAPVPGLPVGPPDFFSLPSPASSSSSSSTSASIHYPSQDPQRLGATAIKLPSYNRD